MAYYSNLEKIYHRQFLGNTEVSRYFYQRLLSKSCNIEIPSKSKYLFITGLARAGTTTLLNQIYNTNKYASICYKHMPFILNPRLAHYAAKLNRETESRERFHKDGILISSESPECLDEPFWIKADHQYYNKSLNSEDRYPSQTLRAYDYMLKEFTRYQRKESIVIKNNNNHIRLAQLAKHFPDSYFLCLFRHPIHHSISLKRTHDIFSKLGSSDQFANEYMNLLGHREFGLYHKPFKYINSMKDANNNQQPETIDYWLKQWIKTHSWYLESGLKENTNIIWICYEELCGNHKYFTTLFEKLGFKKIEKILKCKNTTRESNKHIFNNEDLKKAEAIYNDLKIKSEEQLGIN